MGKDKVLIFGHGFIGLRIAEELQCDITNKKINSFKDVQEEIDKYDPKIIINCVGHTGKRNVDDCEIDKDKNLMANTFVPIILAEVALRNNLKLIHVSSGCIYNFDYEHQEPITEEIIPDYYDLFYSRSKVYADNSLNFLSKQFNVLILRIRIPLDNKMHSRNILNKLVKFDKVTDIPNSITYIPDFMKVLKHLIEIDAKGIYNVVNKGGLRHPELLEVYKKYVPEFKYNVIGLDELNLPRTNLVLSTQKLEDSGFKVRDIHDVLEECVKGWLGIR